MPITPFGGAIFGLDAFGQNAVSDEMTIYYTGEVEAVGVWYQQGSNAPIKEIIPLGATFGPNPDQPLGQVSKDATFVTVDFFEGIYLYSVLLFSSAQGLDRYLELDNWHEDTIYNKIVGGNRYWTIGDDIIHLMRETDSPDDIVADVWSTVLDIASLTSTTDENISYAKESFGSSGLYTTTTFLQEPEPTFDLVWDNSAVGDMFDAISPQTIEIPRSSPVTSVCLWYRADTVGERKVSVKDGESFYDNFNNKVGDVSILTDKVVVTFQRRAIVAAIMLYANQFIAPDLSNWEPNTIYLRVSGVHKGIVDNSPNYAKYSKSLNINVSVSYDEELAWP